MRRAAPLSAEILDQAMMIAAAAGLHATLVRNEAGEILVQGGDAAMVLNPVSRPLGARSVWHGCAPIGRFDAPTPAELAIGDVLETAEGFAASATVLAPALDGRTGQGPIDALRLDPPCDVKIGGRWICSIETVHTQQTRFALVALTFSSRLAPENLHRRFGAAPRLKRLPAWADIRDTAALAEIANDPLWADDLSMASAIMSVRQIEHQARCDRSWRVWIGVPPGAAILGVADVVGRVASPDTASSQVRAMIDDACARRRRTLSVA